MIKLHWRSSAYLFNDHPTSTSPRLRRRPRAEHGIQFFLRLLFISLSHCIFCRSLLISFCLQCFLSERTANLSVPVSVPVSVAVSVSGSVIVNSLAGPLLGQAARLLKIPVGDFFHVICGARMRVISNWNGSGIPSSGGVESPLERCGTYSYAKCLAPANARFTAWHRFFCERICSNIVRIAAGAQSRTAALFRPALLNPISLWKQQKRNKKQQMTLALLLSLPLPLPLASASASAVVCVCMDQTGQQLPCRAVAECT